MTVFSAFCSLLSTRRWSWAWPRWGRRPRCRCAVSATRVKKHIDVVVALIVSAPDNHFAACPDRCVEGSSIWRVGGAGGGPTVDSGIIAPARLDTMAVPITTPPTPDDHFAAGPHYCVIVLSIRRIGGAGGCPTIHSRIVSAAGIQILSLTTPDDHFTAGPDCCVMGAGRGGVGSAVAVQLSITGLYFPPCVKSVTRKNAAGATPDDHFAASPD